jgi:hypothetical protein
MRKSAKRGQPQIFLLCVTLWASAGGVVSSRALAVPNGIGGKQKRAALEGVLGPSFFHSESAIAERGRKKSRHTPASFGLSDWPSPFAERKSGDEVKT